MESASGSPTPIVKHPFRIEHIFFEKISLARTASVPEELQVAAHAEIGLGHVEAEQRYTVRMRVRSPGEAEQPLGLEVIAVAVADHVGEGSVEDQEVVDFINEHLLVAMSSRIIQIIATLTAQMGMAPVWLPSPRGFFFDLEKYREAIERGKVSSEAGPRDAGTPDVPEQDEAGTEE